jgi:hypothetical protein
MRTKKRFKVALSTKKPPQSQVTITSSTIGIALAKLVMTIAPQNSFALISPMFFLCLN